jgi:hypothetical protein
MQRFLLCPSHMPRPAHSSTLPVVRPGVSLGSRRVKRTPRPAYLFHGLIMRQRISMHYRAGDGSGRVQRMSGTRLRIKSARAVTTGPAQCISVRSRKYSHFPLNFARSRQLVWVRPARRRISHQGRANRAWRHPFEGNRWQPRPSSTYVTAQSSPRPADGTSWPGQIRGNTPWTWPRRRQGAWTCTRAPDRQARQGGSGRARSRSRLARRNRTLLRRTGPHLADAAHGEVISQ